MDTDLVNTLSGLNKALDRLIELESVGLTIRTPRLAAAQVGLPIQTEKSAQRLYSNQR